MKPMKFLRSVRNSMNKCLSLLAVVATLTTVSSAQVARSSTTSLSSDCVGHVSGVNVDTFSNWTFKDSSGVVHVFNGSDLTEHTVAFSENVGGHIINLQCGVNVTTSLDTLSTDRHYYLQATGGSGTADPAAVAYPQYKVASIIYAAPGNASSSGFTNSSTDGTTTSITQSFTGGSTSTFTTGFSFLGIGASSSFSLGTSQTSGNTSAFTETFTDSSGVANVSGGASNKINHKNDLFLIWINPAIQIVSTGSGTWLYSIGTQLQGSGDPSPGSPEVPDVVEVFASAMQANSAGVTTVPAAILNPQVINGQTLPGLASICVNLNKTEYSAGKCTLAGQCGCVPNDFKEILAQDPLLNFSTTESPLNADTSGATACANPVSSDKCRYVPVPNAPGSTVQETELLAGPQTAGGNRPVNTFNQTDSNTKTQTFSESISQTSAYSWGVSLFGSGFSSATQWTWTNAESTGAINGTANSMDVSLSSTTVGCNQQIPIFEDTVYHTFVFQQPAGNNSCP